MVNFIQKHMHVSKKLKVPIDNRMLEDFEPFDKGNIEKYELTAPQTTRRHMSHASNQEINGQKWE